MQYLVTIWSQHTHDSKKFSKVTEKAGTGSEPFLGTFMKPMKIDVDLPTEVLELLVEYYCNAYEYAFTTVSNIHTSSENSIVILSKVNQFSRLRIGAEIFGSTHSQDISNRQTYYLSNKRSIF